MVHLDKSGIGIKHLPLSEAQNALKHLRNRSGRGRDFLGWIDLPKQDDSLLDKIISVAEHLRAHCRYVVCVGIGGSYIGARAVIEALSDPLDMYRDLAAPKILYAGLHLDEDYLSSLLSLLKGERFGIINISKSGTTTETSIAFRFLKNLLVSNVGQEEHSKYVVAITDASKGALRELSDLEGYTTFDIAEDIGGRYSVLSPVGLLPIAVAGVDIRELLRGAREMISLSGIDLDAEDNLAAQYASIRQALYRQGKKVEFLATYTPSLFFFSEWWKQLFAESEGKEGKGILTYIASFTTDLHSLGQWIQEGEPILFETILSINRPKSELRIPFENSDIDELNYLAHRRVSEVNAMAEKGTIQAHVSGGVPTLRIEIDRLDAFTLGGLIYFFEVAVAISGYMMQINPFDQPGVEQYKRNMFVLLDKPGMNSNISVTINNIVSDNG